MGKTIIYPFLLKGAYSNNGIHNTLTRQDKNDQSIMKIPHLLFTVLLVEKFIYK